MGGHDFPTTHSPSLRSRELQKARLRSGPRQCQDNQIGRVQEARQRRCGEGRQQPPERRTRIVARMKGKIVKFEPEDYVALDQLARDRAMSFQELADEAFRDLLENHHRPTDLRKALRESVSHPRRKRSGKKRPTHH
jgi:hypothetical protein